MDWSIGLLPEPVLRLYRRVSVISGTFGSPTATAMLDGGERRGLAPLGIEVESGLQQLAAASLLRHEDEGRAFTMLTTVRADAQDRLARSGEAIAMRWAHAYQVLAVAEEAERALPTGGDLEALDRLEEAHDDIRESLEWAMSQGDGTFALRLAGALAEFWRTRGHHTEGRLRLAAALSLAVDPPPAVRRKALSGAGLLASYQGDYRLGEAYLREALSIAREMGDEEGMASCLNWLGTNAYASGDLDAAEAFVSEALEIRRRIGEPAGIALALNALGGVHHFRGDLDLARVMFVESLSLKEGLGNTNGIAVALTNLGLVERDAGHPEEAAEAFDEAIQIWERLGDRQRLAVGVHNAALLALDRGRYDEAARQLTRASDIAAEVGDRSEMAYAMADRVRVDVERGDLDGATDALAASLPRAHAIGARIIVLLALEGAAALAAARGDDVAGDPPLGGRCGRPGRVRVRQHAGRRAAHRRADVRGSRAPRPRDGRRGVGRGAGVDAGRRGRGRDDARGDARGDGRLRRSRAGCNRPARSALSWASRPTCRRIQMRRSRLFTCSAARCSPRRSRRSRWPRSRRRRRPRSPRRSSSTARW